MICPNCNFNIKKHEALLKDSFKEFMKKEEYSEEELLLVKSNFNELERLHEIGLGGKEDED